MVVARSHGLETCPQAAFAPYHKVIREELELDEMEAVVCGMSLGYADWSKVENTLITEREPLDGFVTFRE
jgi:nitroreductase